MTEILNWKPERNDKYKDGVASTKKELPEDVPTGSIWHVEDKERFVIRTGSGWKDVTEAIQKLAQTRQDIEAKEAAT